MLHNITSNEKNLFIFLQHACFWLGNTANSSLGCRVPWSVWWWFKITWGILVIGKVLALHHQKKTCQGPARSCLLGTRAVQRPLDGQGLKTEKGAHGFANTLFSYMFYYLYLAYLHLLILQPFIGYVACKCSAADWHAHMGILLLSAYSCGLGVASNQNY